jgi:hypothetical protein
MIVTPDAYDFCLTDLGDNFTDRDLLKCVIKTENDSTNTYTRSIALVFAGVLVFAMQVSACSALF